MTVLGAILAGGQARRFGANKALALYRGEPLIVHAARALRGQVDALILCGGPTLLPGVLHLPDRPQAGLGPLGGLAAALFHAQEHGFEGVASIGCDTPILPARLVERLREGQTAAYLDDVPLIGWWPSALCGLLDAFLLCDPRRSMRGWAAAAEARAAHFPEHIPNINTPADLAALAP
jgi:molybdenum cofactor guanylyltransferase